MEVLLEWKTLDQRARPLASKLGIQVPVDSLPLYFQYRDEVLRLPAPERLKQFDLLFFLSFSYWLYEVGAIADSVAFTEQQFNIPTTFSTEELALSNKPTCTERLLTGWSV